MVNIFALSTLLLHVRAGTDVPSRNFGQFCANVKAESAKVANVDRVALAQVVVQVGGKCFPNDQHL